MQRKHSKKNNSIRKKFEISKRKLLCRAAKILKKSVSIPKEIRQFQENCCAAQRKFEKISRLKRKFDILKTQIVVPRSEKIKKTNSIQKKIQY